MCCAASFIDPGSLSLPQSYRQPIWSFIAWGTTLAQPFPLGQAEPLYFRATTVWGACYRAEYGYRWGNKKATHNCPR